MTQFTIDQGSYNFRRFGKPWIARIDFAAKKQGDYHWGEFVGNAERGGILIVNAAEGDIIAQGQKDSRSSHDRTEYFQVQNGALVKLEGGKAEAYTLATTPKVEQSVDPYGFANMSLAELVAMSDALLAEIDRR